MTSKAKQSPITDIRELVISICFCFCLHCFSFGLMSLITNWSKFYCTVHSSFTLLDFFFCFICAADSVNMETDFGPYCYAVTSMISTSTTSQRCSPCGFLRTLAVTSYLSYCCLLPLTFWHQRTIFYPNSC